ncbi:MAG: calcium/sodium antiporter [Anaerofustis stercorihominis]|nr:calcium/sodium antiporter [Anaerofustis stercorihominis]
MIKCVLLFAFGLVLLIRGGDWFVDGATAIAKRFRVPEIIIGASIVSIGTTLPEVMVSSASAIAGHGEMAYGNAIGSIICNTSFIAAISIAIKPMNIDPKSLKLPVGFFYIAAIFYAAISYTLGYFSRGAGLILLGIFAVYTIYTVHTASDNVPTDKIKHTENTLAKDIGLLFVGAVLIASGADLLVDNGTLIARELGVAESVIALTFVALGTSLPELVTAITALTKGHSSLSIGNIIGANFINLVFVSGLSVTLSPFSIPASKFIGGMNASLVVDIPVMFLVMSVLSLPALKTGKLSRWQGIVLLGVYAAFCIFQFVY